jgi:hypothetical protein
MALGSIASMAKWTGSLYALCAFLGTPIIALAAGTLFGVWLLALAAMRAGSTQKYERGAFSTLSMGLLFIAVGGAWYLFSFNWLYSLAVILIALAALAIAAAFRHK